MNSKGLNAMSALLKFLVPLAIFLLPSNANAFTSLSSVAGNQVRVNHLTRLQQPMSDPTNEPSREPTCEPTNDPMVNDQTSNQRLEWDAELLNILSPKRGKYSLSQKLDAELPSKIAISISQITSDTSYKFEGAFIGSFSDKFHNLIVKYSKREQLFGFSFIASINGFVGSSALANCCIIRLISFIGLIQLVELIDYVRHDKDFISPLQLIVICDR
jgi:hypothetical protein